MSAKALAPSARLLAIVRTREQLNELTAAILPNRSRLFADVSLEIPDVDGSPELAFIRTASWLYVHYFEAGRVGVKFLVRRSAIGNTSGLGDDHLDIVHALRTWSQHNLNPTSAHDIAIAEKVEQWFERTCGTRVPRTVEHWNSLLSSLLAEAEDFFRRLQVALATIEADEDRIIICGQWEDRLTRDWPAHRFHGLIARVGSDLGRDSLDAIAFFDRYSSVFRDGLRLASDDSDLEREARKLIERALLSEALMVMPITGDDVMSHFSVAPGPEVGRLLECARQLYERDPCDREALLRRMEEACGAVPASVSPDGSP